MSKLQRLIKTSANTRLIPEARPFRKEPKGAREAVLLLHGFTGIPRELSIVGDAIAEAGFAAYCPRFPGHGTTRADFFATGAEDWLRCAFDAYLDLRVDYDTIHVLGHSMGGLVATLVAVAFNAPRLVLLAPAFELSNRGVALSPILAPFVPVISRRRKPSAEDEADPARRKLFADYWADDLVGQAAQLKRLKKAATAALPGVRSKVLVLAGTADDVVPPTIGSLIEPLLRGAASFESRVIAGGGHVFPFEARSSAEASSLVGEWISRP